MPHTGGKFNEKVYQNVAGMNGIGSKGVALSSSYFKAISYRDGKKATLILEDGIKQSFEIVNDNEHQPGTVVTFVPSPKVYNLEPIKIKFEDLKEMCKNWSYLTKGVKFSLIDHVSKERVEYYSANGILDFLKDSINKPIHRTPLYIHMKEDEIECEVAMQWAADRKEHWYVFTNGLANVEGGTSLTGVKTAITNFFKKKFKGEFSPEVARSGLFYVVNCKVPNPSFANQTKTKVNNPELRGLAQRATGQMLDDFSRRYVGEFDSIIELLTKELKAERAAERARKQVLETEKEINNEKKKRIILADKLKDCQIHGPNSGSVLAICEGDSALGALVQARPIDKVALLPIRGKIISALKHPDEKILQNEEVKAIFSALGCGFFNKYNSNKLNYQYVAVASDSDADGANISNLIVTLFYYLCPKFIEEGRLLWMRMPLFVLKYKDKTLYAFSDAEKNELIKKYGKPKELSRKKGIGENTPQETAEAVFGPQKRWEQLIIDNKSEFDERIHMLMGKEVDDRRQFIIDNVDFSLIGE
jgi:DNA gyrase subunit B